MDKHELWEEEADSALKKHNFDPELMRILKEAVAEDFYKMFRVRTYIDKEGNLTEEGIGLGKLRIE